MVARIGGCSERFQGLFYRITIPLEKLEERERARGTSPVGHARSHYDTVHTHGGYDLEIDTSKMSAPEAAQLIKQFVKTILSRRHFINWAEGLSV